MSKYDKSIVAAGHKEVCRSAGDILEAGGNAFDAMVAAGFASAVAEPALTSLGGGGFMVGYDASRSRSMFVDFFVDTPGKGTQREPRDFYPVTVNFSGTSQIFHVGLGSVAVPGTLKGLLYIHKHYGHMPLADILAPAHRLARGHELNYQQAHFLKLLRPIMASTHAGREIYQPGDNYVEEGSLLTNRLIAAYLEQIAIEGEESFYRGEIAQAIAVDMEELGGLLTLEDLAGYEVREHPPLSLPYRDYQLLTPGEPSLGGTLIGLSLALLEKEGLSEEEWGSVVHLEKTTGLMQEVERLRSEGVTTPAALQEYLGERNISSPVDNDSRLFSRGTTHISIADSGGNCASMTCSNGEGSGYFAPGTGVMLNNMMGEDDLHPNGFHSTPSGQRVGSMMSPSLLLQDGEVCLVIGSGGSKRIRTAINQVFSQVIDFGRDLEKAVAAPRLYWDEDKLQVEPGFSDEAMKALGEMVETVAWKEKDVYFGGVHAVIPGQKGAGDPRRGGSVLEVPVTKISRK